MALSYRKRRFVRRMVGYAVNPVRARARVALRRDQHHAIGGTTVTFPPDHNLPFYQRRDPTYDDYAREVVAAVAAAVAPRAVCVVDVGANVGDTSVAVLTAADSVSVVAVEGSTRYARYLEDNLAPFAGRARIVTGFVGPLGEGLSFTEERGTGGFQATRSGGQEVTSWVGPDELLGHVGDDDLVVWKSDIDGFDVHLLVEHWDTIAARSDLLWFEYDPAGTLGDRDDLPALHRLLAASGRTLRIYDNLGRPMLSLEPGAGVARAMDSLAEWLLRQREGHVETPYVDVWAATPAVADALGVEHAWR